MRGAEELEFTPMPRDEDVPIEEIRCSPYVHEGSAKKGASAAHYSLGNLSQVYSEVTGFRSGLSLKYKYNSAQDGVQRHNVLLLDEAAQR